MGNAVGCGHTYSNSWAGNSEREIGTNELSELESYEVETVDRGYHVYVAVWEAAVGQIPPCQREGGNIHDLYAVAAVENNDTPIDNDTPHSMKISRLKLLRSALKPRKFSPTKDSHYTVYAHCIRSLSDSDPSD